MENDEEFETIMVENFTGWVTAGHIVYKTGEVIIPYYELKENTITLYGSVRSFGGASSIPHIRLDRAVIYRDKESFQSYEQLRDLLGHLLKGCRWEDCTHSGDEISGYWSFIIG